MTTNFPPASRLRRDGRSPDGSSSRDTKPGFLYVELAGDWLFARFYDRDATVDFEVQLPRPSMGVR